MVRVSLSHRDATFCELMGIRKRLITLNGMKASEELTDEQSRQVRGHIIPFDLG